MGLGHGMEDEICSVECVLADAGRMVEKRRLAEWKTEQDGKEDKSRREILAEYVYGKAILAV